MSYIDLDKIQFFMGVDAETGEEVMLATMNQIEELPTADVVEVVRCKDCVNYCGFEHCKNGICDKDVVSKKAVYPNDYCSYGERRE